MKIFMLWEEKVLARIGTSGFLIFGLDEDLLFISLILLSLIADFCLFAFSEIMFSLKIFEFLSASLFKSSFISPYYCPIFFIPCGSKEETNHFLRKKKKSGT